MAKFIRSWGTTTGSTMLSLMILAFVAANSNIQRISWSGYQQIQSFKLFTTLAIFFFITSFSLASVFFLEKALEKCRSSGSSPGGYSGQWDQFVQQLGVRLIILRVWLIQTEEIEKLWLLILDCSAVRNREKPTTTTSPLPCTPKKEPTKPLLLPYA